MELRSVVAMFPVGVMICAAGAAWAQDYPGKPIRIVTSAAGGGNDFAARLIAQGLSGGVGQQVIVDNRNSVVAPEIVAKSPPDGYSLLLVGSSFWVAPLLQNTSYDPVTDFSPVVLAGVSPNVLVVHPSLPVKSVKELIALAKARPGELNYASGSMGSTAHLGPELFRAMANVNIVHIPYKGAGPAVNAVVAGEAQLILTSASALTSHIQSGRLRALAVTSPQPSALVPGLPTMSASGLPGYEVISADAIFAPAKTPAAIIARLNQEIVRVLNRADVKEKFFNVGVETIGSTPEQLAARVKSDVVSFGKIIKDAAIRIK